MASIPKLLLLIFTISVQDSSSQWSTDSCRNPNGIVGTCINIRYCPFLLTILQSQPLAAQDVEFLQSSRCGYDRGDPKVCCVDPQALLPQNCGTDLSLRIVGGERAELDEFPWMALLEYHKPIGKSTGCGGVLISKRYVLTAAHCIKGKTLPRSWRVGAVRLGEYNTESDPDCLADSETTEVCADPVQTVPVEEITVHEGYDPQSLSQSNDLALLRLSRDVAFTDYIKPICLPKTGDLPAKLWVAGWGKTESRTSSTIKLKLSLPIADGKECQNRYSVARVNLGSTQVCAGGQRGKDSCKGDSGGPLMGVERAADGSGKWAAVGIVSFGPSPCGMEGWPGVYTRVASFKTWILKNLKP